jgi:hypothetical protein
LFEVPPSQISAFEHSTSPGVWAHITKAELIQDIKDTVADPLSVNQSHTPLCGPTAIVYELIARDAGFGLRAQKKRYVQLCRQLWETGHIVARSMDIKPSDDLRNSPLSPENALSVADWMLIASLRDAENELEDVEGKVSGLEGYSFPGAMKTWTFEVLGFDDADWEACWFSGEIDTIKKTQDTWSKGGVAFLNIDSNLLTGKSAGEGNLIGIHLPDHWVAFEGPLFLDDATGMIQFHCYSWGDIKLVSKTQDAFSEYLYGVVLGER